MARELNNIVRNAGRGSNLVCRTDRSWDEPELAVLTNWLRAVVKRIREFEATPTT